jgi:hypothetical protein
MKKWKVYAKSESYYEVEVMAESKEDAMDKADQLDGSDWVEDSFNPDWEVIRAEEVTE